jgi:hypothetical protein
MSAETTITVGLAVLGHHHRPGGATLGAPRAETRDQHRAAELDLVAIVLHSIHFGRLLETSLGAAMVKIQFASGLDHWHVGIHHHVGGACHSLAGGCPAPLSPHTRESIGRKIRARISSLDFCLAHRTPLPPWTQRICHQSGSQQKMGSPRYDGKWWT